MKEFCIILLLIVALMLVVEAILSDEIQKWKARIEEEKRKNKWMQQQLEKRYDEGWVDGYKEREKERW
jgi:predicted Holliday junction resolvase-like endonuclease